MHSLNQLTIDTVTVNQALLVWEEHHRCQGIRTDNDLNLIDMYLIDGKAVRMVVCSDLFAGDDVVKEYAAVEAWNGKTFEVVREEYWGYLCFLIL